MWFVYTLSFHGIPFYVGLTNDPLRRYREHYYYASGLTLNYLRYNLAAFNKHADLNLLGCWEEKNHACLIEYRATVALASAGFMILNQTNFYNYGKDIKRALPPKYPNISLPKKWLPKYRINIITDEVKKILNANEQLRPY